MRNSLQFCSSSFIHFATLLAILWGSSSLPAQEMSFTPSKDGTLIMEDTGGLANGAGSRWFVGTTAQDADLVRRGVMEFDVSALPDNALVTSVSLTIRANIVASSISRPIDIHRLNKEFGEAGSIGPMGQAIGAPSLDGDATWIHAIKPDSLWSGPGARDDYTTAPSATFSVGDVGSYTIFSTPELVADVQAWANDDANNHGWIFIGNEADPRTAKGFLARETTLPADRPTLTVIYDEPTTGPITSGLAAF
jgi:hypothetical protein